MFLNRLFDDMRRCAGVKRNAWSVIVATAMIATVGRGAALADGNEDAFKFNLYLDVIGVEIDDTDAEPLEMNLIGVPLSLGVRAGGEDDRPGLMGGLKGRYTLPMGAGFSVVTTGSWQKTRHLDDTFLGNDRGIGRASFQYEQGSFKGALTPGMEFGFVAGQIDTRRYMLDGRLSRDIVNGLNVHVSSGVTRHEYAMLPGDNADIGRAQAGFGFRLNDSARFTFDYDFQHKWAATPASARRAAGPTIGVNLSPLDALEIGASYRYCENTEYEWHDGNLRERIDTVQAFGLHATWQDPAADYLTFSADYSYDRVASPVAGRSGDAHDGMVTMALQF
jgi:hypothetical protein